MKVILINDYMASSIITFKADEKFKKNLIIISQLYGINMSAFIKMVLTNTLRKELNKLTENGMTAAHELEILKSDLSDNVYGPFNKADDLINSLNKKTTKKKK